MRTSTVDPVRALIAGVADEVGQSSPRPALVSVDREGPVGVVRAPSWTAYVLVVFPADTDPVLEVAALLRASSGPQSIERVDPVLDGDPWRDAPIPEPGPDVRTLVVELADRGRALLWLPQGNPDARRHGELTGLAVDMAALLRVNLPGSTSLAVAALDPRVRPVLGSAARVAAGAGAGSVTVTHLTASLLMASDLFTASAAIPAPASFPAPGAFAAPGAISAPARQPAPDVLWPVDPSAAAASETVSPWAELEPDDDLLALLEGLPEGDVTTAVRGRVVQWLERATSGRTSGPGVDDSVSLSGMLARLLSDDLVGVQEVAPMLPAGSERTSAAADEVTIQLGRGDVPAIVLVGTKDGRDQVLGQLATIVGSGAGPRLADRHVVQVDTARLAPATDDVLCRAVTANASRLLLVITGVASRAGNRLLRTAVAAQVPAIVNADRADVVTVALEIGDVPIVRIAPPPQPAPVPVAEQLIPIADRLAAAYGVTLAPGVLSAAAARQSVADEPDGDQLANWLIGQSMDDPHDASGADPLALGRARLHYACSRAALRPDRLVRADDVPMDPLRGLSPGWVAPRWRAERGSGAELAALLGDRIVDQPAAVAAVAERLLFAARGLRSAGPQAALLLAGPPGTGKTHTAGVIAEAYFGDPEAVIRIDCGAMYDRHTIASLLGAPPAYVGYDDRERLLTTRLERCHGRCVVLVDEIEKADQRVLDILLAVLDTGLLTDLQQRVADATNAIFVLTSNLGSDIFTRHPAGFAGNALADAEASIRTALRERLRPELLDRIDDVIVYRPLTAAGIAALTSRHLRTLAGRLNVEGYRIEVTPDVEKHLSAGVASLGVRGLRRHVESTVLRGLLALPPGRYQARLVREEVVWTPTPEPAR